MRVSQQMAGRGMLRVLTAVAAVGVTIAVVSSLGWWLSERRSLDLDRLSAIDRQHLFDQIQEALPGVYEAAWFQPEIGYTLRPDTELNFGDDTVRSNELGFRTGPVEKPSQTFRVLFVGDSWTYGMGITEEQSYPKVLERLANQHSGLDRRVESWNLALPGYNTVNQVAAFDFWLDRLRPDAVVFAPSSNDNHSSASVTPSGRLFFGTAAGKDGFGHPHPLVYRTHWHLDSFLYRQRWRIAFERLRAAEDKLARLRVPSVFFYVARWHPALVHQWASDTGLTSPYAVIPPALTLGDWLNATEARHGTPAANELYAQMLYRLLARRLDWRPLPEDLLHPRISELSLFESTPDESEWLDLAEDQRRRARQSIPASYREGEGVAAQWPGPGDYRKGIIGRSSTVLVRPAAGTTALRVRVGRLASLRSLYPITVTVVVPGPGGGSQAVTTLPESGPSEVDLEIPVPPGLRDGSVLDVVVAADRVAAIGRSRVAGSLRLVAIEPVEH